MNRFTKAVFGTAVVSALVSAMLVASPSQAAGKTVVIWCDNARVAIIKLWASSNANTLGTIKVVGQDNVKSSLKTVRAVDAPDIIIGAHDWIGALKADGKIQPVVLPPAAKFDAKVKAAFQISGRQYGVPMQTENVALFRNTKLVPKAPKTFADLEKVALALKKKKASDRNFIPFAVPQGTGGDAYHMYPLFSGLGGYFFGGNSLRWNTSDVGVANAKFIKNSPIIDKWFKEGLIKASVSADIALNSFTSGNAPFYISGPWNLGKIRASGVSYAITAVPTIVKGIKPVPLIGVQGAMLTSWSTTHGVGIPAKKVLSALAGKDSQLFISNLMLRTPANLQALAQFSRPGATEFQQAGKGGVPMAAMTAMNAVWASVGTAWVKATSGASKAAPAFKSAAAVVKKAVK
jgi:arabinogalactan oligomer / maltooligosaccharide transport system substrate-binding protein